jgi:signal transduction histidine kinase
MLVSAAIRNITERKQAEQALKQNREELRTLTGKLLTVQEVERQRIARELHDDISQRLAALTMDTAKIEEQLSVSPQLIPERLHELQANIVEIAQDVHGLSRQLHPSILEDLGLVRALRSKCKTVADRDGMAVELTADGDFDKLSADQALCLYRIVQESLRNIAKHAHTKSARVALAQRNGMALLTIEDEGIGFEREGARASSGLGLVSMEERVRLCGGQFSVQSTRGKGTRVEVCISFETNGNESSCSLFRLNYVDVCHGSLLS